MKFVVATSSTSIRQRAQALKSRATRGSDRFYFVAEILPDSNTDKDIAVMRQRYLQQPDNLYFVLIEQKRVHAEVMARAMGWEPVVLDRLEAALALPEWGFRAPLGDLYRGTPLGQPT